MRTEGARAMEGQPRPDEGKETRPEAGSEQERLAQEAARLTAELFRRTENLTEEQKQEVREEARKIYAARDIKARHLSPEREASSKSFEDVVEDARAKGLELEEIGITFDKQGRARLRTPGAENVPGQYENEEVLKALVSGFGNATTWEEKQKVMADVRHYLGTTARLTERLLENPKETIEAMGITGRYNVMDKMSEEFDTKDGEVGQAFEHHHIALQAEAARFLEGGDMNDEERETLARELAEEIGRFYDDGRALAKEIRPLHTQKVKAENVALMRKILGEEKKEKSLREVAGEEAEQLLQQRLEGMGINVRETLARRERRMEVLDDLLKDPRVREVPELLAYLERERRGEKLVRYTEGRSKEIDESAEKKVGKGLWEKFKKPFEWYKNLPLRYKLLGAGALIGAGLAAPLAGGAFAATVGVLATARRLLVAGGTYLGVSASLERSKEKGGGWLSRHPKAVAGAAAALVFFAGEIGGRAIDSSEWLVEQLSGVSSDVDVGAVAEAAAEAPGAETAAETAGEAAAEGAASAVYEATVEQGNTVWGLLEEKLEHLGYFTEMEHEGQRTYLIDAIKDKLAELSPEEVRELGIESGNINEIAPGETIDFERVLGYPNNELAENAREAALNLPSETIESIENPAASATAEASAETPVTELPTVTPEGELPEVAPEITEAVHTDLREMFGINPDSELWQDLKDIRIKDIFGDTRLAEKMHDAFTAEGWGASTFENIQEWVREIGEGKDLPPEQFPDAKLGDYVATIYERLGK